MKARVSNNNAENKNEIVLSIGMIVKNEEKHLENCLSALKNLTDYISSELIIVDTGSTDRTKEIALKYTDKVYDFEWIDDFAAARNYGLKKAKGKWFMFLDADEYLDEDCGQMIKFFSYPELYEYGEWNCGTVSMYNYSSYEQKEYTLFYPLRLARINSKLIFEGRIHEHYENIEIPIANFDVKVHHYGYILNNANFTNKTNRNMQLLLEEFESKPKNMRLITQICDSCRDDKEKEKYINILLEVLDLNLPENTNAINESLLRAIRFFTSCQRYSKALEVINRFLSREKNTEKISVLDVYICKATVHKDLGEYDNACDAYNHYLCTYNKYLNNDLLMGDASVNVITSISVKEYNKAIFNYVFCLSKIHDYKKAREVLEEFDIEKLKLGDYKNWAEKYYVVFDQDKDYSQAIEIYQKALATKDKDKIKLAVQIFENFYSEHILDREDFVNAIAESDAEGLYIDLMKIVRVDNDGKDVTSVLTEFIHRVDDWKYGYAEAIYLCMKHNIDINDILITLSNSIMKSHFPIIATTHEEYAQTVIDYCKSFDYTQSIHAMLWMTSALETAVLSSANLYEEQRAVLYDTFVCVLSDYIYNIYNQELLNVDDVNVLPELHRFGFYMTLAFTAQNDGDDIGYIRCLREALRLCEPMKDLVSFYLDKFAEKMKE